MYLKPRIDLDRWQVYAGAGLIRNGSCTLATRSSNFGPPSLLEYSKTRNGTPALA
jgi:hypothetical protein